MKINQIVIAPILTEKATDNAKNKVYMFQVNPKSSKLQVKMFLEKIYSVKVESVRVMNRRGKEVRRGRRGLSKILPGKKIAYVKLKEGKIDLFPQA